MAEIMWGQPPSAVPPGEARRTLDLGWRSALRQRRLNPWECALRNPLQLLRAGSSHPRNHHRHHSQPTPLHPPATHRPPHHHHRGILVHPPHRPHLAGVRLARRRRARNDRTAPADSILLARLHDSRNLHVPQSWHPRDEQQQLRRRIHGTHHPQIRIRRRQRLQQPQRRARPARPAPRLARRLDRCFQPGRPARPAL